MPIKIKSKTDGSNAELPAFEDNEEVNVIFKTFRNFIHDISLSAKKMIHAFKAGFFCLDL